VTRRHHDLHTVQDVTCRHHDLHTVQMDLCPLAASEVGSDAKSMLKTREIELHDLREQPTAVMTSTVGVDEIPTFLGKAFTNTASLLKSQGLGPAGMPFARYQMLGDGRCRIEAGFPALAPPSGAGAVETSTLPAGPAVSIWHIGPYEETASAYEAIIQWVAEAGAEPIGPPWEIYYSDRAEDPSTYRTEIVQPYRKR
jgi:effector-binding domain-containing protein